MASRPRGIKGKAQRPQRNGQPKYVLPRLAGSSCKIQGYTAHQQPCNAKNSPGLVFGNPSSNHAVTDVARQERQAAKHGPRQGRRPAHFLQRKFLRLHQIQRQPCQENKHNVVRNKILNPNGPKLTGTHKSAPRSHFLAASHSARFNIFLLRRINQRTLLWLFFHITIPKESHKNAYNAKDEEYRPPAQSQHQGHRNSRSKHRANKRTAQEK